MLNHLPFDRKPLRAVIAALAIGGTTIGAEAATVFLSSATATSSYSINGSVPVVQTETSTAPGVDVDIVQFANSGNISILTHPHLFGGQTITFGNRTSGTIFGGPGKYDVKAEVELLLDLDFSDGSPMFTINLQSGEVAVDGPTGTMLAGDFLQTGLEFLIQSDDLATTYFSSSYDVRRDSTGTHVVRAGTSIGGACADDNLSVRCLIDQASLAVNLDSQVGSYRYLLSMTSSGMLSGAGYDCTAIQTGGEGSGDGGGEGSGDGGGEGSGGEILLLAAATTVSAPCGSISRAGDPIGNPPNPTNVPEPGGPLAVTALGLAALALARRKRRAV